MNRDVKGSSARPTRLTRAERQSQTRSALVAAAADAFADHGVHGASIEDICARAGFTRGAFYSNFTDKDDLVMAVIEAEEASDVGLVADQIGSADSPGDFFRLRRQHDVESGRQGSLLLTEMRAHALRDDRTRLRLVEHDRRQRRHLRAAIEALLGRGAPSADIDLMALIAQSVIDGANYRRLVDPEFPDQAEIDALALLAEAALALASQRRARPPAAAPTTPRRPRGMPLVSVERPVTAEDVHSLDDD